MQFLALVMLAQLHHDLAHQQAPALGQRGLQLWTSATWTCPWPSSWTPRRRT